MTLAASTAPAASAPTAGVSAVAAAPEPERPTVVQPSVARPIIQPTSPERYRVQFTIGRETHDKLRRLQDLLRREIPDGDPAAIFDRAVALLLEKVEKQKLGAAARPRPRPRSIRPGTDREAWVETPQSRDIPRNIKRGAWRRDGGRCAYVARNGHRCPERTFLEFHHIVPYARGGRATLDNISLRCRRHNQYEAEIVFGPHGASRTRERSVSTPGPRNASGPQSTGGNRGDTTRSVVRTP
jgi:hypothetical protein